MGATSRTRTITIAGALVLALIVAGAWGGTLVDRVWSSEVIVTFEREPQDLSHVSFVENLLAREQAGGWTRAEGLIATLRLFAGEADPADVLLHDELMDPSSTGIFWMALEYLEGEPDETAATEIRRLVDVLVFSIERLARMSGRDASAHAPAQQPISFYWDDCEGTPSPCVYEEGSSELDGLFGAGKYRIHTHEDYYDQGWTDDHFDWAMEAMVRSAKRYEVGTSMPQVRLYFSPSPGPSFLDVNLFDPNGCTIHLNTPMQAETNDGYFKQHIAEHLAHCMIKETFPVQLSAGAQWWTFGLAVWSGNEVYPSVNMEWEWPTVFLANQELSRSLFQRWSNSNWLYFQHMKTLVGDLGFINVVASLPAGGDIEAHRAALLSHLWSDPAWEELAQKLTDRDINDLGQNVPYSAPVHTVNAKPRLVVMEDPEPFGVVRLHVVIPAGKVACLEYDWEGELRMSWRPGAPGPTTSSWSTDLPDELENDMILLVTATEPGAEFTLAVVDVADANDPLACSCVAGTWVIDVDSVQGLHDQMARETWDDWYESASVDGIVLATFEPGEAEGTIKHGDDTYFVGGRVIFEFYGWSMRTIVDYESAGLFPTSRGKRAPHRLAGLSWMDSAGTAAGSYVTYQGKLIMVVDMSGVDVDIGAAGAEDLLGLAVKLDVFSPSETAAIFVVPPVSAYGCSDTHLVMEADWGTVRWERVGGPPSKGKGGK